MYFRFETGNKATFLNTIQHKMCLSVSTYNMYVYLHIQEVLYGYVLVSSNNCNRGTAIVGTSMNKSQTPEYTNVLAVTAKEVVVNHVDNKGTHLAPRYTLIFITCYKCIKYRVACLMYVKSFLHACTCTCSKGWGKVYIHVHVKPLNVL